MLTKHIAIINQYYLFIPKIQQHYQQMGSTCKSVQNMQVSQIRPKSLSDVGDYFLEKLNDSQRSPNSANSYKYTKGNHDLNRLMCFLQQNEIQFEDHVYPSKDLLKDSTCIWQRIQVVFKNEKYKMNEWEFQYDEILVPKYENQGYKEATYWLTKYPLLLEQANMYPAIFKPGLYRFMLWVGGSQNQVVIDSQMPVNFQKRYLFASPKKGSGIWMVLMEKALAKSIGNYSLLQSLNKNQMISEITGFPCPNLYQEDHQRRSYELKLNPRKSQYFKIGKYERGKIAIGLWFHPKYLKQALDKHVIVQLIQQTKAQKEKTFKLIETKMSKSSNILIVTAKKGEMIDLVMDQQYLHIFNWGQEDLICNLVVQSEKNSRIWMNQSNEITYKQYKTIKNKMVKNQYQQWHQDPSTTVVDTFSYKLRIKEIRHRLIFCIKNKLQKIQKITLKIKSERKKEIFFEDQSQQLSQKIANIKQNEHKFFVFNKIRTAEYGQFYNIQL